MSPEKKINIDNNKLMAIHEHLLWCNYFPLFEGFSIVIRECNDFKFKIRESLQVSRDKLVLNKVDSSLPLELFWCNIRVYHMMFYHIIWSFDILCVNLFMWFSTFSSIFYQLACFVYFRSSLNIGPNILIFWNYSLMVIFSASFLMWIISSVFIRSTVVFSKFIAVPVALFMFNWLKTKTLGLLILRF